MAAPEKSGPGLYPILTSFFAVFVMLIIIGGISASATARVERDAETIRALETQLERAKAEVALGHELFAKLLSAAIPAIEPKTVEPVEATDWSNWFNSTGIICYVEATNAPSR